MRKRPLLYFGNHTQLAAIDLGTPALADVDFYKTSTAVSAAEVTTFTAKELASTEPPRNITVTLTESGVGAGDTYVDALIKGYNEAGVLISEVVDVSAGAAAAPGNTYTTTKTFRSIESVKFRGWVVDTAADTYTIGFGNELGLGVKLTNVREVFLATLDSAIINQAGAGVVSVDADDTDKNSIDLSSGTYNGTKVARVLARP